MSTTLPPALQGLEGYTLTSITCGQVGIGEKTVTFHFEKPGHKAILSLTTRSYSMMLSELEATCTKIRVPMPGEAPYVRAFRGEDAYTSNTEANTTAPNPTPP